MVEIDTLFQTKTAKKTFWRGTYLYSLYKGLPPPGAKNALQIMSLAAYESETNKAWMIHWKVCRKDWHLSRKRPKIGLCRKISSLYRVSSVSNVCLFFTKQVNYKVSSITKTYALLLSPNNLKKTGKFLLQ